MYLLLLVRSLAHIVQGRRFSIVSAASSVSCQRLCAAGVWVWVWVWVWVLVLLWVLVAGGGASECQCSTAVKGSPWTPFAFTQKKEKKRK